MAIDASGTWWIGSNVSDLAEYLQALTDGRIHSFRAARCDCWGSTFRIDFDADEGVVQRTCADCQTAHFVCDSADSLASTTLQQFECVGCGCRQANIGVGFSLRPATFRSFLGRERDVSWIFVGVRCDQCGVLGCIADWKIDYGPSAQLVMEV